MLCKTNHSNRSRENKREAGFTLVELLVVMVILVLIVGLVAPRVIGYVGSSRTKSANIQIKSFTTALELYRLDAGRYPATGEGLQALVRRPASIKAWNGPYIDAATVPKDPWGNDYHYKSPGESRPYVVFSLGADNRVGGEAENSDVTSVQ